MVCLCLSGVLISLTHGSVICGVLYFQVIFTYMNILLAVFNGSFDINGFT